MKVSRETGGETLLDTLLTLMHLQHEADLIKCVSVFECAVLEASVRCFTFIRRVQLMFLNCRWLWLLNTNLSWMLHHVHHWTISWCTQWSYLTVPFFFFFFYCYVYDWAIKRLWSGGVFCVCVLHCIEAWICIWVSRMVHQHKPIHLLWDC